MNRLLVAALLVASAVANAGPRYDADIIGPMDGETLAAAYKQVLDAKGPEVSIRINSPGGGLNLTLLFIDLVRDRIEEKGLHVTCVGTGMVASAAAILMESPVCQERVLEPQAVLMFHEGYLTGEGPQRPDAKQYIASLNFAVAALIAPRMGMTPAQYLAWIADGVERWMAGPAALEAHMVDRVGLWTGHAGPKDEAPPL